MSSPTFSSLPPEPEVCEFTTCISLLHGIACNSHLKGSQYVNHIVSCKTYVFLCNKVVLIMNIFMSIKGLCIYQQ